MFDLDKIIKAHVDRHRPHLEPEREKRATPWKLSGGCWERFDAVTGERLAWVFPEPSTPEWFFEITFGAPLPDLADVDGHVEPDTAEAQMVEVDRLLGAAGWTLGATL
jgi:hypothetical protein